MQPRVFWREGVKGEINNREYGYKRIIGEEQECAEISG